MLNTASERFLGTVIIYCLLPVIEVAKLNGAFPVVTDSGKTESLSFYLPPVYLKHDIYGFENQAVKNIKKKRRNKLANTRYTVVKI